MLKESTEFGSACVTSDAKSPAFGIDLGTTNSCISILKSGVYSEIIPMKNGKATLPSCVMYNGDQEKPIVGDYAYQRRDRSNVVYSVKKLMGSGKKVKVKKGSVEWELEPYEVSAEILKALVENISDRYKDVKDVVITVPADFDTKQVEDTLKAAKLAKLNVLQILREPTAAALALKLEDKIEGDILVYDLGGGTFDVSLISVSGSGKSSDDLLDLYGFDGDGTEGKQTYVVKSTRGDSNLGGDDLDNELLNIVLEKIKSSGYDTSRMPTYYKERLKLRLENLKKYGVDASYSIPINYSYVNSKKTVVDIEIPLEIEDFYKATKIIFNKTKAFIDDLLAGYTGKLSCIVTVGGSTKNKLLQQMLASAYSIPVYNQLNPDESVSLGAANHASNLKFGKGNLSVLDVLSNGIGVLADKRVMNIIPRDTTLPCSVTREFSTVVDNQEEVEIKVFSGNSSIQEDCVSLGTLTVGNIPKGKAGTVGIIVQLTIDSNGSLECYVVSGDSKEKATLSNVLGKEVTAKVSLKDKKLNRWRNYANVLDEMDAIELNSLLDMYENDNSVESTIVKFIRDRKKTALDSYVAPGHVFRRDVQFESLGNEED